MEGGAATAAAEARWNRWVERLERIVQETYRAHHYRQLYRGLAEITEAANLPPSSIFDAFAIWYVTAQTSSVRRQLDRRRGTVSLWRLLREIAQYSQLVTRERHVALWLDEGPDQWLEREAHENFDRFSGGRDRNRIDADLVRADIRDLETAGRVIERYADQAVAHTSVDEVQQVPTYDELNAAIDQIARLAQKYLSLLKAVAIAQFEPVIQGDWRAPFRQAWIPPEGD